MKTYTHITCFSALLGLCDFATAQYPVQPLEDACFKKPILSESKVYKTDVFGKKPYEAKPIAIVTPSYATYFSKPSAKNLMSVVHQRFFASINNQ
jgi:hypothetical protein